MENLKPQGTQMTPYEKLCEMITQCHAKGISVFGGDFYNIPNVPEDDPDTIAAAMD